MNSLDHQMPRFDDGMVNFLDTTPTLTNTNMIANAPNCSGAKRRAITI